MVYSCESDIINLITFFSGEIFIKCVYMTDYTILGLEDILCNPNVYSYN